MRSLSCVVSRGSQSECSKQLLSTGVMGDPVMSIEMCLALTSRREWLQWKRLKAKKLAEEPKETGPKRAQNLVMTLQRPVKIDLDRLEPPPGLEHFCPAETAPPAAALLQPDEPRLADTPRARGRTAVATAGVQASTPQERSAVTTRPRGGAERMVQQPQQVQQQIIALPADPPQQPQPLELEIAVTQASGGTHPSASQAFAAPQGNLALLSREMLRLDRLRDEGNKVTHAKARQWSWQCVSELDRFRNDVLDISHDDRFDWRCYVAFRTDAVAVIGNGIVKFEFRYFPNKIGNEHFVTGDFVAHRLDGTCVRLHPSEPSFLGRDREATPMYGRLEEWLPLAGVKAYGPKGDGEPAYVRMMESRMPCLNAYRPHISEDDPKGNLEARAFLQRQFEEWAADPCRGRFRRTVSQSEWNCIDYFINSCAADATLHDGGVVLCGIALTLATHAWLGAPCFIALTANGTRFHLIPAAHTADYFRLDWEHVEHD